MLTYTVASQGEEGQAGPEGVCRGGVGTVQEAVHKQIARPTNALWMFERVYIHKNKDLEGRGPREV